MHNFCTLLGCLGFCVCWLVASQSRGGTIWDEAVNGDLSGDRQAPTTLMLSPGSNELFATSVAGDLEYVTFTVPPGGTWTELVLRSYSGNDALAFLAIQQGTTFTEPPFTPDVSKLLGWAHFGPRAGHLGNDFLAETGNGAGAQGFTPPLPAGPYTMWLQQTGTVSSYQLDFVVVPEPASLLLAGVALATLITCRGRFVRR
jgi:hypothetical protein